MSQFYDQASLVMVPSGYKTGKVYSQKPLSADGELTFTRASTATRVNASGLIESVATGVPRLDYTDSTCPKLLLEPSRTNLYTYSEQLNQWTASFATVTANYAVSPDGYQNADRVQFTAGALVYRSGTGSAGENTMSVYAKATNGTSAKFRFFANGATTFSSDQTATGEWQRFTFTYTYSAVTAGLARPTTNGGVDDVIFYGFQHEIGSYPTSYIPTLAAATTRGVDNTLTSGLSSSLPQTAGTLFWEIDYTLGSTSTMLMHNTGVSDYAFLQIGISGSAEGGIYESGTMVDRLSYSGLTSGRYKMAFAYETNSFALYINGVLRDSGTSGSTASVSMNTISLDWNTTDFTRVHQALLFPTRLTNAQLAELTTL